MRSFWLFCHLLGAVMWIGGGFSAMWVSIAGNKLDRSHQGIVARLIAAIYGRVLAPGAALSFVSGIFLTMTYMGGMNRGDIRGEISPWLMVMQGCGLLGAALVLGFALPSVNRLVRIDPMTQWDAFCAYRRRQRVTGMIATTLAVLSLVSAVAWR